MEPTNPWANGPIGSNGLWISDADRARIDRFNAKLSEDDTRRVRYLTQGGRPAFPTQWCGNPWQAPILLLLLNPAWEGEPDAVYADPRLHTRVENMVRGDWDEEYPNAWLSPEGIKVTPWYANVPFGALYNHLVKDYSLDSIDALMLLSQRCAVVELSPWSSYNWSSGAYVSSCAVAVQLVQNAMNDPNRIVLLARGEDNWKAAGLLDADLLPKSRGIRAHQCRITEKNFPTAWKRTCEILTA